MAGERVVLHGQNPAADGRSWIQTMLRMGALARRRGWRVVMVGGDALEVIPAGSLKRMLARLADADLDLILTDMGGEPIAICRPQDAPVGAPRQEGVQ